MEKYKRNDKVIAMCNIDGNRIRKEFKGKVIRDTRSYVSVEWEKNILGHNCRDLDDNLSGKQGFCWNVPPTMIKKIEDQLEFEF